MNKKVLYESIMKNVAKEVKRALYEAEELKPLNSDFPMLAKYDLEEIFETCNEGVMDNLGKYKVPVEKALERLQKTMGDKVAEVAATIKTAASTSRKALMFILTGIVLLANNNVASAQMNGNAKKFAAWEWAQVADRHEWVHGDAEHHGHEGFVKTSEIINGIAEQCGSDACVAMGISWDEAAKNAVKIYNACYHDSVTFSSLKVIKKHTIQMQNADGSRKLTIYILVVTKR